MADEKTFTQADIDAAVEKAVGPLKDKIAEVMDEAKEAKRKLRSASEIKPEDLSAAEDRADKAEAALKEAQRLTKDAVAGKEKAETALKAEQGHTHKLLIQDGLHKALLANGINDEAYIDALTAKFASGATVTIDGDVRKAVIGDKPLDDAVKEFAASDAGKKFVSAPNNSGGGARGGESASAAGKTMTRAAFDALDPMAKGEIGQQMAKGELKLIDEAA